MDFNIEKELLELVESVSLLATWKLDFATNKLVWSDALFRMLGYQPNEFEITLKTSLAIIHPDDRASFLEKITNAIKTGTPYEIKKRFVTKDHKTLHILSKGKFIKDDNNKPLKLLGVLQDISSVVQLEEEYQTALNKLKSRNEFIETIIKNLPLGIAVNKISNGEATIINSSFSDIYGWHNTDLTNIEAFFKTVYPDEIYRKKLIERIYNDIQSGDPARMHWENIEITTSKNEKKIINAKNIPLVAQDLMISTVVDITESINLAKKHEYLFQNNPAIMLVFEVKTLEIIDCNEVALQKYGYGRDEFLSLTIKDLNPLKDVEPLNNWFINEANDFKKIESTWKQQKKNGEIFWASVSGAKLMYDEQKCFLIQLTDITEKLAIEQTLKESEAKYKQLFENNPAPMVIWDFETKQIVDCNIETLNLYGYTREELLKLSILDIRPKEDLELLKKTIQNEKTYGPIHKNTWRHIKKNGELLYVNVTGHLIDYNGRKSSLVMLQDVTKQQVYEAKIEENNQRFEYVTNATSDAIWDWDFNKQFIYWGRGFYKLFGYTEETSQNTTEFWTKNIHPDDLQKIEEDVFKAINGNATNWSGEYRFKKANGEYAYVVDQGFIIRNKVGKATRVVGSIRDITQKNIEVERLKLLESVITHTNDAVLITEAEPFDLPGPRIVYVNEAFTRMTGYTSEEVIGKTPRILQGPLSDKKELKRLSNALRKWETHEITTLNYKKNGEPFWINFTVTPVANDKGWYTHWIAIERDVTHQINNEKNLKKALSEKNEILESIGDGFFAINQDWIVTYWNKQVEEMLGISKDKIIGNYLWNVFPDHIDSETYIKYHEAMKTQELVRFEHYFDLLNKWYEISIYPSNSGLSVYLKDISERVSYTQAIEQKNKTLKEIAYTQSHIVRAPLARILGLTNLISELDFTTKESANLLTYLNIATEELDQVIREIVNKTENL